jgi:hypothetical protein
MSSGGVLEASFASSPIVFTGDLTLEEDRAYFISLPFTLDGSITFGSTSRLIGVD